MAPKKGCGKASQERYKKFKDLMVNGMSKVDAHFRAYGTSVIINKIDPIEKKNGPIKNKIQLMKLTHKY